ncbi:MAG TPA: hypothetical protein VEV87_01365 [Chitinophagaceae bacterium]|nr:hypothetical protein [Chitinophagaceae bacterium]
MKKFLFLSMILGLPLIFTACTKSNNFSSIDHTSQNQDSSLIDILKAGSWVIDYYFDEEDKTADFAGYIFTFGSDSALALKKGSESYTGQWQVVREDGVSKVWININTINLIQKLNDKWQVKTINSTKLEMKNDNPSSSEFMNIKRI